MVTMRWLLLMTVLLAVVVQDIVCPPVKAKPEKKDKEPEVKPEEDVNFGLEYERYLKEVVNILETDETFKKKLEDSNISDIKSGEIARHLELVSHNVRTKLDELKRQELDRLRQIQRVNMRRQNGSEDPAKEGLPLRDLSEVNRLVAHLDHNNPHTFEIDDLSKLIKQATEDLESLDKQRKDEFKKYEMEKEHLHKKKMEAMDDVHRAEEQRHWEEQKEKHKKHPKLHHPGSKDQLEEVWEESDGLNKEEFNPRTFFMLHDTNGDGMLDPVEVEALFQKELDKIYDPNAPEDDMMERYEEMNRMREHVMNEVDKNKDSLITLDEFLESTKNEDFEKDPGWKTLDDQELFSEDELAQFEKDYESRRQFEAQPGEIGLGDHEPEHGDQPPEHHEQQQEPHHVDPNQLHHEQLQQHQQPPQVPVAHQQQEQHHQQQFQEHQQPPPAPQQQQQHHEQQQLNMQQPEQKLVKALHQQPAAQEHQPVVNMEHKQPEQHQQQQQQQQQQHHEGQPPAHPVGNEPQHQQPPQ